MADVDVRIGTRVAGKLLVEERIGAGGAATVYRAVQEPLGRTVALKILTSTDESAARRFEREAKAIARLRHENVVVIHDFGRTDEGASWIAMEHIDGPTLRVVLEERALDIKEAVDVARGICRGLAHAHQAGVAHRDLKPENVMLVGKRTDASAVRVVDFGLARVSLVEAHTSLANANGAEGNASITASITGTPAYMAPEQIEAKPGAANESTGAASDVYALGVMLYEMLAGTNPFRAETPFKTLLRHVEGPVPPAPLAMRTSSPGSSDTRPRADDERDDVDERDELDELDELVVAMLAKDPARRPTSSDLLAKLDRIAERLARRSPSTAMSAAMSAEKRAEKSAEKSESAEKSDASATKMSAARVEEPFPMTLVAFGIVAVLAVIIVVVVDRLDRASVVDDGARENAASLVDAGDTSGAAVVDDGGRVSGVEGARVANVNAELDVLDAGSVPVASASTKDVDMQRERIPPERAVGARTDPHGDGKRGPSSETSANRAPVDAGPRVPAPTSALARKVRSLEGCSNACASDIFRRFDEAAAGDFEVLKRFRDDVDACLALCRP